jgi:hypothetical protein
MMDRRGRRHASGSLVERLNPSATLLEKTLGWLEDKQRFLSGEVERIAATVQGGLREEEVMAKLEAVERELAGLKATAASSDKPLSTLGSEPIGDLIYFAESTGDIRVDLNSEARWRLTLQTGQGPMRYVRSAGLLTAI